MNFKECVNRVDKWDKDKILKYNGVGGPVFTKIFKFASFFGRETIWFFVIAFYLFVWYDPFLFVYIGATFMNGLIFILIVKNGVKRARPFDVMKEIKVLELKPTSLSFPSWHAYNVISQALLIGFLTKSPLVLLLLIAFAILVCFSRVQLGVHYPTDVIFGAILGACGFIFTWFFMGPLFLIIVGYFESISTHGIYYAQINPMIFREFWYTALCIAVFGGITFSSIYKFVFGPKEKGNKKN